MVCRRGKRSSVILTCASKGWRKFLMPATKKRTHWATRVRSGSQSGYDCIRAQFTDTQTSNHSKHCGFIPRRCACFTWMKIGIFLRFWPLKHRLASTNIYLQAPRRIPNVLQGMQLNRFCPGLVGKYMDTTQGGFGQCVCMFWLYWICCCFGNLSGLRCLPWKVRW